MEAKLIPLLQKRTATIAIGPSTGRRMGPKGTVKAAREHLARLDLAQFSVTAKEQFEQQLNEATEAFVSSMPNGARYWGSCRKFLNIFLRDAAYNHHLRRRFSLNSIESWLELPLDSHVAAGLSWEEGAEFLPKWKTVIGLDPIRSKLFQDFANTVARRKNVYRVHLDLFYLAWPGTACKPLRCLGRPC
jgi:hypothetical protein